MPEEVVVDKIRDTAADDDGSGRVCHRVRVEVTMMTLSFESALSTTATFSSICRHLAVSWGAASVPYLIGVESVPEPLVTFVGATLIGVIGGLLEARSLEPRARAAATSPRKPAASASPVPPAVVPPPLSRTPQPQPQRQPQRQQQRQPQRQRQPKAIDLERYRRRSDAVELQCPHCGAFEVVARQLGADAIDAHCAVCATRWQQGRSLSFPDVSVRSWLHR